MCIRDSANRLDEKVRRSGTAYYYVNDLVGKGMLVDAVKIQGIEVAHIMMLESEQPFHCLLYTSRCV